MIITNKLNMPDAFVKAIQNSRHNADKCLSATTLLKGTKEIILTDRYFDEITIDASDEVWAVFGTAVHSILEHQEDEAFKEEFGDKVKQYEYSRLMNGTRIKDPDLDLVLETLDLKIFQ